jgi:hypothetical protein
MRADTFRDWLAQRGCTFDKHARGSGHAAVTVRREHRSAELPLLGSHKRLDDRVVRRVCEQLELDWSELPGPQSRA